MTEIRIYVEGGGDGANGKAQMRNGFGELLRDVRESARKKKIEWHIVACGSRSATFDNFKTAVRHHPDSFNVLLVDSEELVSLPPWQHLQKRDGWQRPSGVDDQNCHLMVVTMEAWVVSDVEALARFYGHHFIRNAIPRTLDVESIPQSTLNNALQRATRGTKAGGYHKIRHAAKLFALIDVEQVRRRAKHFERLRTTLTRLIGDA